MAGLREARLSFAQGDIQAAARSLKPILGEIHDGGFTGELVERLDAARQDFRDQRETLRHAAIAHMTEAELDADIAMRQLETMRWLHRCTYHVWRMGVHLENALSSSPKALLITEEHRIEAAQPAPPAQ